MEGILNDTPLGFFPKYMEEMRKQLDVLLSLLTDEERSAYTEETMEVYSAISVWIKHDGIESLYMVITKKGAVLCTLGDSDEYSHVKTVTLEEAQKLIF